MSKAMSADAMPGQWRGRSCRCGPCALQGRVRPSNARRNCCCRREVAISTGSGPSARTFAQQHPTVLRPFIARQAIARRSAGSIGPSGRSWRAFRAGSRPPGLPAADLPCLTGDVPPSVPSFRRGRPPSVPSSSGGSVQKSTVAAVVSGGSPSTKISASRSAIVQPLIRPVIAAPPAQRDGPNPEPPFRGLRRCPAAAIRGGGRARQRSRQKPPGSLPIARQGYKAEPAFRPTIAC